MILETERLILREMTEEDFDALYLIFSDVENMKYYPYIFDKERVATWIERNKERYRTYGYGLWAVCLKNSGEVIGDCGLTMQNIGGEQKPEIGYHIRRDMQRKGYAKESAKAVRDWTFQNTPFKEVYSYMKDTNLPSFRTAISYGARLIKRYEDEENGKIKVCVLFKEDWKKLFV